MTGEVSSEARNRVAASPSEKLDASMRFLRSAERGQVVAQLQCATLYPHLRSLCDPTDPFLRSSPSLQRVRDHCVELASIDVTARVQSLSGCRRELPGFEYQCRKEQILVRLKRLLPGQGTTLNAVADPDTLEAVTEPSEMADILTRHWGNVFSSKPTCLRTLQGWLRLVGDRFPSADDPRLQLTQDHVHQAIAASRESTPGLDGIPFYAYKLLGPYASSYIFDVAEDLQDVAPFGSPSADFNHAFLCCLPKRYPVTTRFTGPYFLHPQRVRSPLSIPTTG